MINYPHFDLVADTIVPIDHYQIRSKGFAGSHHYIRIPSLLGPEHHRQCPRHLFICRFSIVLQIVRINGSSPRDDAVVVVGAHQDS